MKTLGLILLLLALILLSHTVIELSLAFAYDPPSVFNRGPGGVSEFVSMIVSRGFEVETVFDMSELLKIDPRSSVVMLFSPDTPLTKKEALVILSWVKSGGIVIVLDELRNVENLTNALGVSFSNHSIRIHSVATCRMKNISLPLVLNVYRYVSGGEPLCTIDDKAVAVMMSYGEGKVVVIGDSSLVINHVLHTTPIHFNLIFVLLLITGKNRVVFLELHRVHHVLRIAYPLLPLQSTLRFIQMAIRGFFSLNPVAKAIALILTLTLSAILSVLIISHETEIPQKETVIELPEPLSLIHI